MADMIARKRPNRRKRVKPNEVLPSDTVATDNLDNWVEILTCTGKRMLIKATPSVGGGPLRVAPFDPNSPPDWL